MAEPAEAGCHQVSPSVVGPPPALCGEEGATGTAPSRPHRESCLCHGAVTRGEASWPLVSRATGGGGGWGGRWEMATGKNIFLAQCLWSLWLSSSICFSESSKAFSCFLRAQGYRWLCQTLAAQLPWTTAMEMAHCLEVTSEQLK